MAPLRVDRSWLRRLRHSYGRASGVPVCLGAESCRGMCRCDFGSLHFAVEKGGRLSNPPPRTMAGTSPCPRLMSTRTFPRWRIALLAVLLLGIFGAFVLRAWRRSGAEPYRSVARADGRFQCAWHALRSRQSAHLIEFGGALQFRGAGAAAIPRMGRLCWLDTPQLRLEHRSHALPCLWASPVG